MPPTLSINGFLRRHLEPIGAFDDCSNHTYRVVGTGVPSVTRKELCSATSIPAQFAAYPQEVVRTECLRTTQRRHQTESNVTRNACSTTDPEVTAVITLLPSQVKYYPAFVDSVAYPIYFSYFVERRLMLEDWANSLALTVDWRLLIRADSLKGRSEHPPHTLREFAK
jgi:hypothetical protein